MYTSLTFLATAALASAATSYKASFTEYGSGDDNGSGNCNVATTACGYYTNVSLLSSKAHCNNRSNHRDVQPGYSAAVSQNLFGVGPGAGAGPACGTCYNLTVQTDSSGSALSNAGNSIVVKVTNLCPCKNFDTDFNLDLD